MSQPTPDAAIPDATLGYEPTTLASASLPVTLGLVGIRLIGLWLLTDAAVSLPSVAYAAVMLADQNAFGAIGSPMRSAYMVTAAGPVLLYVAMGLFLIIKAPVLALRMFGQYRSEGGHLKPADLMTLLIVAVGLLTIANGIPTLVGSISQMVSDDSTQLAIQRRSPNQPIMSLSTFLLLLSSVAQPAIGFFMVYKARRLAELGLRQLQG